MVGFDEKDKPPKIIFSFITLIYWALLYIHHVNHATIFVIQLSFSDIFSATTYSSLVLLCKRWVLCVVSFKWLAIFASTWAVSTLSLPSRHVECPLLSNIHGCCSTYPIGRWCVISETDAHGKTQLLTYMVIVYLIHKLIAQSDNAILYS